MTYKDLEKFASEQQMIADKMTLTVINEREIISKLAELQCYVDFNVIHVYEISPVLIHLEPVDFVCKNATELKRKLTLSEFFKLDLKRDELKKYNSFAEFKSNNIDF